MDIAHKRRAAGWDKAHLCRLMGLKPKPIWMQSPWLGTLQGLGLALPVDAQDHGMSGRVEIKPDDVTDLPDEEGIGGELEAYCLGADMAMDEWLTEIGGGPNCKRKLFLNLMERIEQREVAHLPIAHRDRLSRFGCDWFEPCAKQHGCTLTVVNQEVLSSQAELVEDLTVVVDAFACRLPGLRTCRRWIKDAADGSGQARQGHAHPAQPGPAQGQVRAPGTHRGTSRRAAGMQRPVHGATDRPRHPRRMDAAGYDRHGLTAVPGRATRPDAPGDIHAYRKTTMIPVNANPVCYRCMALSSDRGETSATRRTAVALATNTGSRCLRGNGSHDQPIGSREYEIAIRPGGLGGHVPAGAAGLGAVRSSPLLAAPV